MPLFVHLFLDGCKFGSCPILLTIRTWQQKGQILAAKVHARAHIGVVCEWKINGSIRVCQMARHSNDILIRVRPPASKHSDTENSTRSTRERERESSPILDDSQPNALCHSQTEMTAENPFPPPICIHRGLFRSAARPKITAVFCLLLARARGVPRWAVFICEWEMLPHARTAAKQRYRTKHP